MSSNTKSDRRDDQFSNKMVVSVVGVDAKRKVTIVDQGAVVKVAKNLPTTGASGTSVQEQLSSATSSASQSEDDSSSNGSSDDSNGEDSNILDIVTDSFDGYIIDMSIQDYIFVCTFETMKKKKKLIQPGCVGNCPCDSDSCAPYQQPQASTYR